MTIPLWFISKKTYADIEGAYTMINQQFVEHEIAGKYKYTTGKMMLEKKD